MKEITQQIFEAQQQRRFGTSNPERTPLALWEWVVKSSEDSRSRYWSEEEEKEIPTPTTPSELRRLFGQERDYSKGPGWTFDRMGGTRTPHPDGRMICIAGEHEDHYEPDFCIDNDVVVIDLDGSVMIFSYPRNVFPPTDFHTATLVGDRVIVIGRLGYLEERQPGATPVMALDLTSYKIAELPSQGVMPGWIFEHEAKLGPEGMITISGGKVYEEVADKIQIRRNFDDFLYDPSTGHWKRLTERRWRQFSIVDEQNKVFIKGQPFTGCCSIDSEPWKDELPEVPDFGDMFVYVKAEALLPQRFEYESVFSEEYSAEDRIIVDGVDISITVASYAIEIIIEGNMDETKANAIVQDIKEGVEANTGRNCEIKQYQQNSSSKRVNSH